MDPRDVVKQWVKAFNQADAARLAAFYAEDAINHQVVRDPVQGRDAIREMFAHEFRQAEMVCIIENLFQDGEWAILEWSDPNGLRGCGFFRIENDQIVFQRGYFDQKSFEALQG